MCCFLSALCSLSCILPHSVFLFHLFLWITTYMQMTHNFSSPSIRKIFTPTSVTYKMLYNRSLFGWLLIFSLSILLKLNLFLLDLNNKLSKMQDCSFTTSHSARNLGFIFDEHLTFSDQITALSKSCYYHIRERRCIRLYLDFKTASTIPTSIVHSKLDYTVTLNYINFQMST